MSRNLTDGAKILRRQFKWLEQKRYVLNNKKMPINLLVRGSHTTLNSDAVQFTHQLNLSDPSKMSPMPVYRVMDENGRIIAPDEEPQIEDSKLVKMYSTMVKLSIMDKILYESQRQGRISFYMTNYGEEATHLGSAAALSDEDVIYGQYREVGVLFWRGFTFDEAMNQCYGNKFDKGKGKQMPIHYGSKRLNFVTISSPLSTQMPQASGSAYALKRSKQPRIVICYFGDGAASEGDAHAAFNFAATLDCPVIFFCRNNGYAISTPTTEQYRGDGIAGRGAAYGISAVRVDGNDILAVYNATTTARKYALSQSKPVIIEAMTYRVGHHSTSDDSTAYRPKDEVQKWATIDNPIDRALKYLTSKNLWDATKQSELEKKIKAELLESFARAELVNKPAWQEMFMDVYAKPPRRLMEQQESLKGHLAKYAKHYPTNFERV